MSSEESDLEWDHEDLNNTSYNQELSNSDNSQTKLKETVNEIVAALQPSDEGEWESASSGEQSDDTQLDTLDENPQTQSPSASSTPAKSRKFSVIKAGSVENLIDKIEQKSKPEGPKTRSNTGKTKGVSITKSRGVTEIGRIDPTTSSKYKSAKARQSFEKSKTKAKQKLAKMGDQQKYDTHRLVYVDNKEYADSLIASANAELAKSQRTQQDMQTLDGNYNNLIGLRNSMKKDYDSLGDCIRNVGAASDSWADFLTLKRCYMALDGTINQAITNAKLVIDIWHKDNDNDEYDSNENVSNEYDSNENDSSEDGDCVPNEYCWLCEMSGHYFLRCRNYWHGPETREKLKQLNKCDVCLTNENVHGEECSWTRFCHKCGQRHHYITCAGLQDNHPGSYILNKR